MIIYIFCKETTGSGPCHLGVERPQPQPVCSTSKGRCNLFLGPGTLFLALLLLAAAAAALWPRARSARVDQNAIVGLLALLVQLLHEVGGDVVAALLPPFLLGIGLGLNLLDAGEECCVRVDLVGGLEDGCTPVGRKTVGLVQVALVSGGTLNDLLVASAYLHHYIPELSLHLALSAREALEQVIAHAALLEERCTRLLCAADVDDALDVLDGTADKRGAQDALGNLRRLLLAGLRVLVQQRQVDVFLEVLAKPGLKVCLLCWLRLLC